MELKLDQSIVNLVDIQYRISSNKLVTPVELLNVIAENMKSAFSDIIDIWLDVNRQGKEDLIREYLNVDVHKPYEYTDDCITFHLEE